MRQKHPAAFPAMQGYLDKSLHPISEEEGMIYSTECPLSSENGKGEIYISQNPLHQSLVYVVHFPESDTITSTAQVVRRNGKTYVKISNNLKMIPWDSQMSPWELAEYDGSTLKIHFFPHGPVTRLSSRERCVLV